MSCSLLVTSLQRYRDFRILRTVFDKEAIFEALQQSAPNVLLMGETLEDGPRSGICALREIQAACPEVKTVLLMDRTDPRLIVESFRSGVRGIFLRSDFELERFSKCIRSVSEGQVWINNSQVELLLEALVQTSPAHVVDVQGMKLLSEREEAVVRLVSEGLGNREIAEQMKLSEHTVKNHLFRIFDKLGISNRVELVLYVVSNTKKSPAAKLVHENTKNGDVGSREDRLGQAG